MTSLSLPPTLPIKPACSQALSPLTGLPLPSRQSRLTESPGENFVMPLLRCHLHTINFIHFKCTIP